MGIRAIFWPKASSDDSSVAIAGRVLHVAMLIIGSIVLVAGAILDDQKGSIFFYLAIWTGCVVFGRLLRFRLACE